MLQLGPGACGVRPPGEKPLSPGQSGVGDRMDRRGLCGARQVDDGNCEDGAVRRGARAGGWGRLVNHWSCAADHEHLRRELSWGGSLTCPTRGCSAETFIRAAYSICCSLNREVCDGRAQGGLCYERFQGGTCQDLLGADVPEEDCCMNPKYGYQAHPGAPCHPCRPAEWSAWSPWGACSVSCREGVQRRSQTCLGLGTCPGGEQKRWESQACSMQECCPVMGGWSAWGPWGSCSVTCAEGLKKRERSCAMPAPACGGSCPGQDTETQPCDTYKICPIHGNWGHWGEWGPCSATCSPEEAEQRPKQRRWRVCNSPAPSVIPPGLPCSGSNSEDQFCTGLPHCPVDGGWSDWKPFSPCSVTCGIGRIINKRTCTNPPPLHGGKDCPGLDTQSHFCNTKTPCPVDGHWSEWGEWSLCTRPGFTGDIRCQEIVGQQKRTRTCEGRAHNGKRCDGPYIQFRSCYNVHLCLRQGQWSEWSPWGLCVPACGENPVKVRKRVCEPTYPKYTMETQGVGITGSVNVSFWGKPIARCQAIDKQAREVQEKEPCLNVPPCPEEEEDG
ncbi:properdin [Carettochelys insculpta]|uniref:properdin n=1 Tax=Carettochelys insculpta TaxID=44489 RepID=UPI003EB8FCDE